jgi:thiol-disulfide isomerase/thioredoxin
MIDIVVLSQPYCQFCDDAQVVLARLVPRYPISVRQIALDSYEGQDLAARHGVLFAPGVLMNGRLVSYGRLSERRLRRQLDRHLANSDTPEPAPLDGVAENDT